MPSLCYFTGGAALSKHGTWEVSLADLERRNTQNAAFCVLFLVNMVKLGGHTKAIRNVGVAGSPDIEVFYGTIVYPISFLKCIRKKIQHFTLLYYSVK